jgi:iron complex transport system substrate-binding protein
VRIVSLLPSATDIVCTLGLREQLVGRTHECDWPPGIDAVPVVTGDALETERKTSREIDEAIGSSRHSGSSIYTLNVEALRAAKPDLILTQELCDVCAVSYTDVARAARLLDAGTQVVSLEPRSIEEILDNVALVGRLTGADEEARRVLDDAHERLGRLRDSTASRARARVFCCEWLDPVYAAGHWVPDQVEAAGGADPLGARHEPSRPIEWERVLDAKPEALVIMPCGFRIDRALGEIEALSSRPGWSGLPAVRDARVWAVDGPSYFNRPGPRVVRGAEILAALLHGVGTFSSADAVHVG